MKLANLITIVFSVVFSFVFAQDPMTVSVTTTKYSCNPGTAKIKVSGGISPFFYNWNNGHHGETANDLVPGNYNVSIVDGNGKDTLINFTIEEEKCRVGFTNAFSPNNDGINDLWYISNVNKYPSFVLQIFNRWGQLVHQQKEEFEPWNGKHLGSDLPAGTYYFIFYYSGTEGDLEKGSITILR